MEKNITGFGLTSREIKKYFHTDTLFVCSEKNKSSMLLTEASFERIVDLLNDEEDILNILIRYIYINSRMCYLKNDDEFWVLLEVDNPLSQTNEITYLKETGDKEFYFLTDKFIEKNSNYDFSQQQKIEMKFGAN
ncbi:MAG: hypothetical protein R3Y35_11500 [Clostridia bacterium]